MSAFILDKAHIDALVDVAAFGPKEQRHPRKAGWYPAVWRGAHYPRVDARDDPNRVGQLLWLTNHDSVATRYPNLSWDELPGPGGLTMMAIVKYQHTPPRRPLTAIQALKALASYEYQSCESDDWSASPAKAFCDSLRASLICALPGYDDAAWEIEE